MAQDPFDSLTPRSASQLAQGKTAAQDAPETDQIKSDIERTRVEMSETLGEIQDRLRPDHLLQQARENVASAATGKMRTIMHSAGDTASTMAVRARGAGTYLADYACAHPVRIAVSVGALTWWMLRGRGTSYNWDGAADTQWDDSEAIDYGDSRTLRERARGYASSAAETVGSAASAAAGTVSAAAGTVGEYASSARETAAEYAGSARTAARRAGQRVRTAAGSAATTVDNSVQEYPMTAGLIALAVGAAIGLAMPRTELEDYTMGETRDRAMERARVMAQNLKDNVTQKVATATEDFVGESIKTAAATPPASQIGRV